MALRASSSGAVGLVMVVVMAALCSRASAQAGCAAMVVNLTPCVGYMTSNMSAPPSTCCTQLDNIVQTEMGCLCMFLVNGGNNSPFFRIPMNQTQVLSLPGACSIKTGPLSQCNAVGMSAPPAGTSSPVAPGPASPATPSTPGIAPSPSGTSPTTMPVTPPSMPNAPSGNGSKAVPGGPAVGSSARLGTQPLFFCLLLIAITSYASSVFVGF